MIGETVSSQAKERTIMETRDSALRKGGKSGWLSPSGDYYRKIIVSIDSLGSIDFTPGQYFYPNIFVGNSRLGFQPITKKRKKKDGSEEHVTGR